MNDDKSMQDDSHMLDKSENNAYDDEIALDETNAEGEPGVSADQVKKLREKLHRCVEEKQEYLLGWQRTKADFVNARKANEEEKKELLKFAQSNLIEDLLPVVESFNQAWSNKEVWEGVDKNWRTGVEYIYQKLFSTLEQNGLKELNPLGDIFDPAQHASTGTVPATKKEDDHRIVEVVQKGYALNGKILKPPNVKVAVFKEEPTTDN